MFFLDQPEADPECKREENQNDNQKVMEMTGWSGQSEQLLRQETVSLWEALERKKTQGMSMMTLSRKLFRKKKEQTQSVTCNIYLPLEGRQSQSFKQS